MKYSYQFNPICPNTSQIGRCLWLLILTSLLCLEIKPIGAETLASSSHTQLTHQFVLISQNQSIPASVTNAVRQDLSRRTKLAPNQFKLVEAKAKTWPDGCLGLAKPDQICTMALVAGWRVVFSHHNHTWIYRTDSTGRVLRLEKQR